MAKRAGKVGMVSLGCPKNQMDAELMLARLRDAGYEITAESGLADGWWSIPAGLSRMRKRKPSTIFWSSPS